MSGAQRGLCARLLTLADLGAADQLDHVPALAARRQRLKHRGEVRSQAHIVFKHHGRWMRRIQQPAPGLQMAGVAALLAVHQRLVEAARVQCRAVQRVLLALRQRRPQHAGQAFALQPVTRELRLHARAPLGVTVEVDEQDRPGRHGRKGQARARDGRMDAIAKGRGRLAAEGDGRRSCRDGSRLTPPCPPLDRPCAAAFFWLPCLPRALPPRSSTTSRTICARSPKRLSVGSPMRRGAWWRPCSIAGWAAAPFIGRNSARSRATVAVSAKCSRSLDCPAAAIRRLENGSVSLCNTAANWPKTELSGILAER